MLPVRPAPFIEAAADQRYMKAAIGFSRRGLGLTYPNPSVAALVVRFDGHRQWIVGRGVTAPGGRPHAERIALQQAGEAADGATLYVTLEPCNRHSRTGFGPSCTDQIISSGIRRVVVSALDPSAFADGRGMRRLRQSGIEVVGNVHAPEGTAVNLGHSYRITRHRPLVQLKLARTADGFAGITGRQLRITGEEVRAHVHLMRAEADAIIVGIGTVLTDDPELTCRLPGLEERSPIRIVLDSTLKLPLESRLVRGATIVPVWVIASVSAPAEREFALRQANIEVMRVPDRNGRLDLHAALGLLADRGITRLMLEGGPALADGFASDELIDRITIWQSPRTLADLAPGEAGVPALGPHLHAFLARPELQTLDPVQAGPDIGHSYERR